MSTTINGTTVRFERDPADWRKYRVTVQVASRVKPGLKAQESLDPGKAVNPEHLIKGIGAAAALCAEYLGKRYSDMVDPSCCVRDAIQAFGEECRLMGELAKGLPLKLHRLRESGKFSEKERELIQRMIYLTDKGERLTRDEADWVNVKVGELHGAQL